jgi:hypothetical protein
MLEASGAGWLRCSVIPHCAHEILLRPVRAHAVAHIDLRKKASANNAPRKSGDPCYRMGHRVPRYDSWAWIRNHPRSAMVPAGPLALNRPVARTIRSNGSDALTGAGLDRIYRHEHPGACDATTEVPRGRMDGPASAPHRHCNRLPLQLGWRPTRDTSMTANHCVQARPGLRLC